MSFLVKHRNNIFLLGFIIILFFLYAYNITFNQKPSLIHHWRQSDCLSIAKNYYEEGMHFLQPKIHWQGAIDGRATSEMPLINYTVAALWKVFGEHEGVYRLFNYLIFILSVFVFFNTLIKGGISFIISFFFTSLILNSPLLVYYGFNFLADVPALSFAIMAFCLLYKFYISKNLNFFYAALLLATIAVLLKASAVFPLLFILFLFSTSFFNVYKFFDIEKLFQKKTLPSVCIFVSITIIVLWYRFAREYNLNSHNNVFLTGALPIWEMNEKNVLTNLSILLSDLFAIFMNRPMFFLLFLGVLFVSFNLKSLNAFLKYAFLFSGIFFVVFILLFFQVFDVHDYYLTNLMIFPVITFLCIGNIFKVQQIHIEKNRWIVSTLIILIVFNSLFSAAFYRLRTIKDDKICHWYPFFSKDEKKYNDMIIWRYQKTMGELETIKPDLRNLGIKREDLVISTPDFSPNSSLYLMDQKGYTVSFKDFSKDTSWKKICNYKNAKYFIICDSILKDSISYKQISHDLVKIFKRRNVEIYKIKK